MAGRRLRADAGRGAAGDRPGGTRTVSFRGVCGDQVPDSLAGARPGRPAGLRPLRPARRLPGRPEPQHLPAAPRRPHRGRAPHDRQPAGRRRARTASSPPTAPRSASSSSAGDDPAAAPARSRRRSPTTTRRPTSPPPPGAPTRAPSPQPAARRRSAQRRARPPPAASQIAVRHHVHRPRLRRLHRAAADHDVDLVRRLAVQGGQHVHRRRQPRLRPAQPHRRLGHPDHRAGLDADPDVRRAAGAPARSLSRTGSTRPRPPPRAVAAADDAIAQLNALGLGIGNPVYFDMEAFSYTNAACLAATRTFLGPVDASGCTPAATSPASTPARTRMGAILLDSGAPSATLHQPDDIWFARWNGQLGDRPASPAIPDQYWANHQRIHQYQGGHQETWGGITSTSTTTRSTPPSPPRSWPPRARSSRSPAAASRTGSPVARRST